MQITTDPKIFLHGLASCWPTFSELSLHNPHASNSPSAPQTQQPLPSRWPKLMRKRVLGEYLGISTKSVDQWVRDGRIPPPSITASSRLIRWNKSEVDQWLDDRLDMPPTGTSMGELLRKQIPLSKGER